MKQNHIFITGLTLFLLLAWGCSNGQEEIPGGGGDVKEKVINLMLNSTPLQGNGTVTRSANKVMDLSFGGGESETQTRAAVDESKIKDLCVFQFASDSKGNSSATLIGKTYLNNSSNGTTIPVALVPSIQSFLYICTNVGNITTEYLVGSSTYKDILNASLSITGQDDFSTVLPMSGCSDLFKINTTVDYINITLTRMVAKVTFTCQQELPPGDKFEVIGAALCNVPQSAKFVSEVSTSTVEVNSYVGIGSVNGTTQTVTYVWYMPENKRGNNDGATSWIDRIERNAPIGSSYIELNGNYTSSGGIVCDATYVIYLGNGTSYTNYDVVRNHHYRITSKIKGLNLADLRVTTDTNLSADGLANCYLASENNHKYCFNGTVRGNGNTEDYAALQYPTQGVSLMPSKVINTAPDAVTIPVDQVKDAVLMWETATGVITKINWSAASGCVRFETGKVKGNALVAVRDANEKILWSWHIWRTDGVGLKELDKSYKVEMQTYDKRTIYVMDRNIGSNFASIPPSYEDCIEVNGLYYQFGRKDPFAGAYAGAGIGIYHVSIAESPGTTALGSSIENPHIFYYNSSGSYNWISTATLNSNDWMVSNCLWGDNSNEKGIIDSSPWDGNKTIYDPSPAGWRVAPADTWTGVLKDDYHPARLDLDMDYKQYINKASGTYSNGWTFVSNVASANIYFPASGRIAYTNGVLSDQKVVGYIWTSSPGGSNSLDGVACVYKNDGVIYIAYRRMRAYGFQVRCAKE